LKATIITQCLTAHPFNLILFLTILKALTPAKAYSTPTLD
jgi:hypothetical protein